MKYIKMLGLLAVAAAALMAFSGTASATTVTSPAGTVSTPTIEAESINGKLHGSFITVECSKSTVKGTVEQHGANVTVKGNITSLTFTGCNYATTVLKAGYLEVHGTSTTGNGTLTSTGAEILIHTSVGQCIFTTSGTDIGLLTGSNVTKGKAVLDIASASIPRTGGTGGFFCGSSGTWTGNYTVTAPSTLEVH